MKSMQMSGARNIAHNLQINWRAVQVGPANSYKGDKRVSSTGTNASYIYYTP